MSGETKQATTAEAQAAAIYSLDDAKKAAATITSEIENLTEDQRLIAIVLILEALMPVMPTKSRALALAKTNVETGYLWLKEALNS